MFMIMFVLDDPKYLDQILEGWSNLGIPGATIVESTGLHRRQIKRIPMRYLYGNTTSFEVGNTTLFVVVPNEEMIKVCLEEIERVVGDLDEPNTGIFTAWPLAIVKGIPGRRKADD